MNRMTYQNQGMQRCGAQGRNSERNAGNMRNTASQQMKNRNCEQSHERAVERSMDYRYSQERNSERNMGCRQSPEENAERNMNCGCMGDDRSSREADWQHEVPTGNRGQLLSYIDEVSFGAYEALLYLDTHPDCPDGLRFFRENNEKRQFALKEYTRLYGPLNLDRVRITCDTPSWEWVNQPWPWEGGAC